MLKSLVFTGSILIYSITSLFGQELMNNGGFEIIDISIPTTPPYIHPIYLAPPWNNIANTCDVHHSGYAATASIAGVPHAGDGNGRFVAAPTPNYNEFCYGVTDPLTIGETYIVSFWIRKDFSSNDDIPVGCIISETTPSIQPSPFSSSHTPQLLITPMSTQYIQASFCYTAQTSGVHYVSFGPWIGYVLQEAIGFYLDDVSVSPLPMGTPLPSANLTIPQTTYCSGDNVVVDGSLTTNEDGYIWEVYRTDQGPEILEYNSGIISGQVGTLDVSSIIGFVNPGECYRVYLTALGACPNTAVVNFCYVDPNIDFIYNGDPVCEGDLVDLSVTGDNGWTYQWYVGASTTGVPFNGGLGVKNAQVTPTIGNSTYTVLVTTPEGCTHTVTYTLTVHSQNNIAPWMNGINGGGNYTIYVSQGDAVSFTSTLFNDNSSEVMDINQDDNISTGTFAYVLPLSSGGVMNFDWSTDASTPLGNYYFTLNVDDKNACAGLTGTFTFNIVVICDYCPVCIYYEDRTPTNNPLPGETKVGDCIYAGWTAPVETGNADVLFQAGNTINLGPLWYAGPGYQGIIDPSTCVTDCEACCAGFSGFTIDEPIPNIFSPNGDGVNDFWFAQDADNPFCAFDAHGFSLFIINQWGNPVHQVQDYGSGCCSYVAPSVNNSIPYSSIFWDGTDEATSLPVTDDAYYFYILTLFGCGQEQSYNGFIYIPNLGSNMILPDDPITSLEVSPKLGQVVFDIDNLNEEDAYVINDQISLVPNPTSDFVLINGLRDRTWTFALVDDKGNKVLSTNLSGDNQKIDIKHLASGTYYVVMTALEQVYFNKLIVN